jgi:hypothetical protein
VNADSLSTVANYLSTGAFLIQILTGFIGSLIAGALVAQISQKQFNRAIKRSEKNIESALNPIKSMVATIAHNVQTLAGIVPAITSIGEDVKLLAQVTDKVIKGLEKTK